MSKTITTAPSSCDLEVERAGLLMLHDDNTRDWQDGRMSSGEYHARKRSISKRLQAIAVELRRAGG